MDSVETFCRPESGDVSTPLFSRRDSIHIAHKSSWGTPIPPPSTQRDVTKITCEEIFDDDIELSTKADSDSIGAMARGNTLDTIAALGLSFNGEEIQTGSIFKRERFSLDYDSEPTGDTPLTVDIEKPFNKWIRTLQRKAKATTGGHTISREPSSYASEKEYFDAPAINCHSSHKKSSSGSSFGFVTAVKSASISLASFSVAPQSRRTGISSRQQKTDLSSKASNRGRLSEDSSYISRTLVIDQAVTNRLIQRRRIIEELIATEESYIADVKFLMTVYVNFLASIPSLSFNLRASINRNLNDIIELHEELLGELHRVVPHSEYTQPKIPDALVSTHEKGHTRWRSLDAIPEKLGGTSWLQKVPGMTADPKVAADVASVFSKRMNRFFVYEEYGAKYDFLVKDAASAYRTIPQWETFQKGLETLASSLASINIQESNPKKALTIGDLLVKPIQRVCKYPLLFAELLKQTPVYDCPDSHMEIENVLIRLREATHEINRATDDPRMKITMEKTWLLQDRLTFTDMPGVRSQNSVRALGHIHLCGVLHVSWQTKDGVDGQYLICLLYRDFLLMAAASRSEQVYTIQACIGLSEVHIEEVDNGRGLQCHTAPFSWKLVFECDHHLYEITMTACSPKEELEWRSRIIDRSFNGSFHPGEQLLFTSISLPIKAMGQVFGKPGTIARRMSIHRATTVGPNTGRCQVIIKNTNAFKETSSSASINRSQSLLTTNRIPVLAPSRSERIRIETLLSDVWTREILPYPGMTGRSRSEHLVRTSASSMMRKLSVASITSNFTKRSGSMVSLHKAAEDDSSGEQVPDNFMRGTPSRSDKHSSGETYKPTEAERLSIIQDEKEIGFRHGSVENLLKVGNPSPAGTLRRLATLQASKSWSHDVQRTVVPPLRTSSRNQHQPRTPRSVTTEAATAGSGEEKENSKIRQPSVASQGSASTTIGHHTKEVKHGKRLKGRQLVAGALSFFR